MNDHKSHPAQRTAEDLSWFHLGNGRLVLTSRPKLKQCPAIKAAGCDRIVSILGKHEEASREGHAAKTAGLAWTLIPIGSGKPPEGDANRIMRQGLREIASFLENGESVLIHCSAGIHRTGMMAYALLRRLGQSEDEALVSLCAMRPATRDGMHAEHLAWGNQLMSGIRAE